MRGLSFFVDFAKGKVETSDVGNLCFEPLFLRLEPCWRRAQLTIKATKNASIVITLEDTGVGIPESIKSKMFKPLVTTKSKGQGLGLAVVKRLVDALNGRISFESEVGNGTKFTIELPNSSHE